MIDQDLAYSRPQATAARLSAQAADAHRFTDKTVLLTGEVETLATENGELCLLDALRLLPRTLKHVHVALPPQAGELRARAEALAHAIQFGAPIVFCDGMPQWNGYDAILNIGWRVRPELPWTTINSNGWVARISSRGTALPRDTDRRNPVGALGAVSLGVAEIFKRLIALRPERADMFDGLQFSFYSYEVNPSELGPELPAEIFIPPTLLAGGGALGNGIALLASQLPLVGKLWVLDRQTYGDENLGTCVVLGPGGLRCLKAEYLADFLRVLDRLEVSPLPKELEGVKSVFGCDVPYPVLVLAGFDNVPARHRLQELWPDWLVDGAIGDFGVQVCAHYWGEPRACLKCQFVEEPQEDHRVAGTKLTGLRPERIENAEDVVSLEDVEAAPEEHREELRKHVGQKICSVVRDAALRAITASGSERRRFSPSVPFVACASAALVVGKALRLLIHGRDEGPSRFVFDILTGPEAGVELSERPSATCDCVRRAPVIRRWREGRALATA